MSKTLKIHHDLPLLRQRYYRAAHGKGSLLRMISEVEVSEHVYDSNAIENSTLTLEETEKILQQITIDRGISQRELFEARNLARVVQYIESKSLEAPIAIEIILLLHKMLITNIRDDIAGRLRIEGEWVRVADHIAPDPRHVFDLLGEAIEEYNANISDNVVRRISQFHLQFEYIHPFVDGNGRIGRVLNNYLLIREGYVPINIKYTNRSKYYSALREFDKDEKTLKMEELIGRALAASYHKRLAYLEGKKIIALSQHAKDTKVSYSSLLNKAERQTIEAFMEKGVWKIGV
jgi:Fic family protein